MLIASDYSGAPSGHTGITCPPEPLPMGEISSPKKNQDSIASGIKAVGLAENLLPPHPAALTTPLASHPFAEHLSGSGILQAGTSSSHLPSGRNSTCLIMANMKLICLARKSQRKASISVSCHLARTPSLGSAAAC